MTIEPNFYSEAGRYFMVHCPKCELENYSMMVSTGMCAWCGYKVEDRDEQRTDK